MLRLLKKIEGREDASTEDVNKWIDAEDTFRTGNQEIILLVEGCENQEDDCQGSYQNSTL